MDDTNNPSRATDTPEGSVGGDDTQRQQTPAKNSTIKDKQCQYCHQAFTSSSLGRHLDQYLFKKKPDGIHDVEEIRRIRSGITRRQARTSTGKRDSPDRAMGKSQHDPHGVVPLELNSKHQGGVRMMFNTPTWHATGVINDIPNPSSPRDGPSAAWFTTSQPSVSIGPLDYASRGGSANSADTARALELALREVLDNIKAATSRVRPRLSPFDFDLQSQTFPALCLQMLPPPPSLFSVHPFPAPGSFPLQPPGPGHVEIVRQALRAQIEQWKSDQLASATTSRSTPGKSGVNLPSNDPTMITRTAQQHDDISSRHLDLSFQHWMALSPETQREHWHLEITRAFAREVEKRRHLDHQLERVQQEANQLRAQVEKLGSCQWPREFAIFPPDLLPLPRDVTRELDAQEGLLNPASSRWDYDTVVAKWKRVVMHDKSMGRYGVSYANSVSEENSPTVKLHTDDAHKAANRSQPMQPPAARSPIPPAASPGQAASTSSQQQTPPYQPQENIQSYNGVPQAKRQRLMNGSPAATGAAEGRHSPSAGDSTNGTSSSWGPHSVQSLLLSGPGTASAPTPPPSRPSVR
ncbi:hypothetical protein DTO166G4_4323 [Paecilomyces variotii]|uniref:Uncharacterized protein n=1 Tax=Byssochlamys spectabilis TaxID=264951 RepID=A0A443HIA2_BYSSP|nr:hypothetical protein C8Q69DRAFT_128402 [Paecilomyces variotii]KAJ9214057.1 hypothetical protein DTO166G4_4323 [Paecilomyces variotii]KAJ9241988.1 hypothetical protein DTO166G5_1064 [Paecilomyces variotii]KAJ9258874.1 hypothetical protein DTO195F2_5112 [Paecilomyces variotii]KAJ9364970.1 hypothetical protein DTO280E4_1265 [Paecilomyces variotii]KAJ9372918.1 hypothetical protein DTO282E5_2328 [Paecilomyces variotii]